MDTDNPMPFEGTDVQRVARHLEQRHPLVRRLFGLSSHGVSRLLRSMWFASEARTQQLATVEGAFQSLSDEMYYLQHRLDRSVMFLIDEAIKRRGSLNAFVIVLSPAQFRRLDGEYDCPDQHRTRSTKRWAYTYEGYPVYTMANILGPLLMDKNAFEKMNPITTDLNIREM